MNPTDAKETVDVSKSFDPLNTPFQIIAIAGILVLISIPDYQIKNLPFNILLWTITVVVFASIILSLSAEHIIDEKYNLQLRLARSAGIAGSLLSIMILGDSGLQRYSLFYKIVVPCIIQILIFGFYIFVDERTRKFLKNRSANVPNYAREKRTSFLQIALITTALLLGMARNAHNLSLYYTGSENDYFAARDKIENDSDLDNILSVLLKKRIAAPAEETSGSRLNSEEIRDRYIRVGSALFICWLACILFWLYFLVKYLTGTLHLYE